MAASVTVSPSGSIGPVAAGWSMNFDAMPLSPLESNGSTGQVDFSAVTTSTTQLAMNNSATFSYTEDEQGMDLPALVAGVTYTTNAPPQFEATTTGIIDSVNITGNTSSFTMGTLFTQFTTPDIDIPWVSSGSPLGALDLAWQLVPGNLATNQTHPPGRYWSLQGHDNCFDHKGKQVFPQDHSRYVYENVQNEPYCRYWNLKDAYASHQWSANNHKLYSYAGTGSSPTLVTGMQTVLAFTADSTQDLRVNFGKLDNSFNLQQNGYAHQYGYGPFYQQSQATGKVMAYQYTASTKNVGITTWTNTSTAQVSGSYTVDLSTLDLTTEIKWVISHGWVNNTTFKISLWWQDANGVQVTWTSGNIINTGHDLWAQPWWHTGPIRGLYTLYAVPMSFDPTTLLANYETGPTVHTTGTAIFNNTVNGGLPPVGNLNYAPIMPYTGTLWDYLCQVFGANEWNLRSEGNAFRADLNTSFESSPLLWTPATTPTLTIDNQNVATEVEVDAQLASLTQNPWVYDSRTDGNQVYSVSAGRTSTFTINTTWAGGVLYNPEPVDTYSEYLNYAPFGGYTITGADELPIQATQWCASGGNVLVRQVGVSTIEVTVVCPDIIDADGSAANDTAGINGNNSPSYFFGLSDGQNQWGCFSLATAAGGRVQASTFTFPTGASYASGNSSPGAITNPCATSMAKVYTLAANACRVATGPNISLSGVVPLHVVASWGAAYPGLLPGFTFYYKNLQWRLQSLTIQKTGMQFTAVPTNTYQAGAWSNNWSGQTVDQFKSYWAGMTYDDMKTILLSTANADYTEAGQIQKNTVG